MKGKLYGLVGYKNSGKTTVAKAASEIIGACELVGFTDPIAKMLIGMGIPAELINDKSKWDLSLDILCGHSIRYAFETLGTEWGVDHIGLTMWSHIAMQTADEWREHGISVMVHNVRTPWEFDTMTAKGATMIAFHRPELIVDLHHTTEQYVERLQKRCSHFLTNITGNFEMTVQLLCNIIK